MECSVPVKILGYVVELPNWEVCFRQIGPGSFGYRPLPFGLLRVPIITWSGCRPLTPYGFFDCIQLVGRKLELPSAREGEVVLFHTADLVVVLKPFGIERGGALVDSSGEVPTLLVGEVLQIPRGGSDA